MSDRRADLHLHTYYSDGSQSPQEVVEGAAAAGLCAIAIADHDTVDALPEALEAGARLGVEVISGVELSAESAGKDIHILGYMFDTGDSPIMRKLGDMQQGRMERMKKMIVRLQELGISDISYEDVAGQTRSDAVGRLHLARMLVARGHVASLDMAFVRYLGDNGTVHFPKYRQTPAEAIRLIRDSGGLAVMAHPMLTQRDELIRGFVEAGLDGIECYYPNCSMQVVEFYLNQVRKYSLIATGGSDAHGSGKPSTHIGKSWLSYDGVELMRARLRSRGGV